MHFLECYLFDLRETILHDLAIDGHIRERIFAHTHECLQVGFYELITFGHQSIVTVSKCVLFASVLILV